jgi:hypothetical protein
MAQPDLLARFAELGSAAVPGPASAFTTLLNEERRQWAEAVRTAGIRVG